MKIRSRLRDCGVRREMVLLVSLPFGFTYSLNQTMKLRSSKSVRSPSASCELTSVVRINAHRDTEVSYRCASVEATDESSASFRGECVDAGLLRAECLPSDTTRRRRK